MINDEDDINFEEWREGEGKSLGWGKYRNIPHIDGMKIGIIQRKLNGSFDLYKKKFAEQFDNPRVGWAWDHPFIIHDYAYGCDVFVIQPYYSWNMQRAEDGYGLCLLAMEHVAAAVCLDIEPFHSSFHSPLTTAFAVRFRGDSRKSWEGVVGNISEEFRPKPIRSREQRILIEARDTHRRKALNVFSTAPEEAQSVPIDSMTPY